MKKAIKTATTFLSIYYAYMTEYRAELILWMLSGSLPLILMGVWTQAAQTGKFALQPAELVRYFLMVFLVRQLTVVWVIWEFEKEVVQGKLSFRLLQPLDPVWHHVASHLSERIARLPFAIALAILCILLYPEAAWQPTLGQIVGFTGAIFLVFGLRFLIQYTFSLLAFWTERASALEQIWFIFYLFLSGLIAPIELFPESVRQFVLWTPFPYLVHFPAAILIGLPIDLGQSLLVMLGWGAIFFVANRWLWRQGLKQYSGMGA
ncbi:ABC transporter permease [Merismopedia glauca]|uniref:Multidrug ABC transporter permease n=1 Tax=Merismopedia glauca CCAP 1448/3 TaxID=1296344 RepID=A0A2T1C913_9CYAN|nr:ABC-2 family transporter protein [Merismopedia glauca]PSB04637.1 multidrug ABC transporter permease [Merismopedia glauca CCAP 1448/3]